MPQPDNVLAFDLAQCSTPVRLAGVIVICAGGGGIPVIQRGDGSLVGSEAGIYKDHASALPARMIGADRLLSLTGVDAFYRGLGTATA